MTIKIFRAVYDSRLCTFSLRYVGVYEGLQVREIFFLYVQKCVVFDTHRPEHQITVTLTGHSKILGPRFGICLISPTPSGAQNLEVAPRFLENLWAYGRLVNELTI